MRREREGNKRREERETRTGHSRGFINTRAGREDKEALRIVAGCGLLNSDPANSTISPLLSRTRPPFHRQIQSGWAEIAIALASSLLASSRAASPQPSAKSFRVHSGRSLYYYQGECPASDPVHRARDAYRIAVYCVCPC